VDKKQRVERHKHTKNMVVV